MPSPSVRDDLAFDERPMAGSLLKVGFARGASFGAAARDPRSPHRHALPRAHLDALR